MTHRQQRRNHTSRKTNLLSTCPRAYDVAHILNDYKMFFRKEEYFYGADKANLLAYFGIEGQAANRVLSIEAILAEAHTSISQRELARLLNLFLYGHLSAQASYTYLKAFCQTYQPPTWRVLARTRFSRLVKFIASFAAISHRNAQIDAKLETQQAMIAGSSRLPSVWGLRARIQREALVFNQDARQAQLDSLFRETATPALTPVLRTMNDYTEHYRSGLAEEREAAVAASRPGLLPAAYWQGDVAVQKEAAVG